MEGIGWEIRPAGWFLLFLIAALLIYYLVRRPPLPPDGNQGRILTD
jgi:hypothetical protein